MFPKHFVNLSENAKLVYHETGGCSACETPPQANTHEQHPTHNIPVVVLNYQLWLCTSVFLCEAYGILEQINSTPVECVHVCEDQCVVFGFPIELQLLFSQGFLARTGGKRFQNTQKTRKGHTLHRKLHTTHTRMLDITLNIKLRHNKLIQTDS